MAYSSPTSLDYIVSRQIENLLKIKALTIGVKEKEKITRAHSFSCNRRAQVTMFLLAFSKVSFFSASLSPPSLSLSIFRRQDSIAYRQSALQRNLRQKDFHSFKTTFPPLSICLWAVCTGCLGPPKIHLLKP